MLPFAGVENWTYGSRPLLSRRRSLAAPSIFKRSMRSSWAPCTPTRTSRHFSPFYTGPVAWGGHSTNHSASWWQYLNFATRIDIMNISEYYYIHDIYMANAAW